MEMLKCDGYKMFNGEMEITPKNPVIKPFTLKATWLYKPDTKCWYNNFGNSYCEEICRPCVCEIIK